MTDTAPALAAFRAAVRAADGNRAALCCARLALALDESAKV
jgi:hypothetical protein